MYVKVENDKSLIVTVFSTIYRGETGTDTIVFLVPSEYEETEIARCSVMLRYITPNQIGRSEQLKLLPEMYNGYLQYEIDIDTDMTAEAGDVTLWLSCISYQDAVIFKTGELSVEVKPSPEIEKYLPPEDLDQLDRLEVEVSNLKNTKADNLIFDAEDGSLQLSASGNPIGDEVTVDGGSYNIIDVGGAAK